MRVLFFVLFLLSAVFSIWSSLETVFYTPQVLDLAADYYADYPYYVLLGFLFWGGLGLCYALIRKNSWEYSLSLVWVWTNIASLLFVAAILPFNNVLSLRYLMASTPIEERDIGNLAEMVGTGVFAATIIVAVVLSMLLSFFSLWLLTKNRDYFSNTNAV